MFLNKLNRKNKKLYKRFCTALNLSQSNSNHLKAFIHYLKDLNNNPDFKYANNNTSIIRGCSLNLIKNNHRLY